MTSNAENSPLETHCIPDTVTHMATALEERLHESTDTPLASLIDRSSSGDLQSALERWILDQIDIEDPEIADAIFHVLSKRVERQLLVGARSL